MLVAKILLLFLGIGAIIYSNSIAPQEWKWACFLGMGLFTGLILIAISMDDD